MKVASNQDGPTVWGSALLLSLAFHAGLVAYLMSVDVIAPETTIRDAEGLQIEVMVIERLDSLGPLPTDAVAAPLPEEADPARSDAPEEIAEPTEPEVAEISEELPEVLEEETLPEEQPVPEDNLPALAELEDVPPETELETEAEQAPQPVEDALLETAQLPELLADTQPARPELPLEAEEMDAASEPAPLPTELEILPPQAESAELVEPDLLPADTGQGGGGGALPTPPVSTPPVILDSGAGDPDAGEQVAILSYDPTASAPPVSAPLEAPLEQAALPLPSVEAQAPAEAVAPGKAPDGPAAQDGVAEGAQNAVAMDPEELRQLRLLIERIRLLSDRPCLLAVPRRGIDGRITVELVGADATQIAQLEQDIFEGLDLPARGTRRLVAAPQCAALDFVRLSQDYPVMRLGMALARDPILRDATRGALQGIGRLQAAVIAQPGWHVTLLLVDDSGVVQDLTGYLFEQDGSQQVDLPVRRSGGPGETRQLLLALASAGPLTALQEADGQAAEAVFREQGATFSDVPIALMTVDIR